MVPHTTKLELQNKTNANEPIVGRGKELFEIVQRRGWEGIVAKEFQSNYLPGRRGHAWVKVNNPIYESH